MYRNQIRLSHDNRVEQFAQICLQLLDLGGLVGGDLQIVGGFKFSDSGRFRKVEVAKIDQSARWRNFFGHGSISPG